MEDNIFFSCGNIILIPSKILSNYPRFSWMSEYFKKIKQGVVVLISDTTASLETIDIVNIIAYAALEFKKKKNKNNNSGYNKHTNTRSRDFVASVNTSSRFYQTNILQIYR